MRRDSHIGAAPLVSIDQIKGDFIIFSDIKERCVFKPQNHPELQLGVRLFS